MKFLSDPWIDALGAAAARADQDAAGGDVCIQHEVRPSRDGDGPGAVVAFWFRARGGALAAGAGYAPDADVWVTSDHATAAALFTGAASAQELFRAGRLRLRGNVARLVAWSESRRERGDPFADLRANTEL